MTATGSRALPKLAGLKFNIVPESATRQVGLANGQYALLPNIDAATALQLKGKPNVKLAETLELAYTLIGMNVSKPPFDNPKVREALNYALNRKEIVDAALFGAGVPGGPLSPALKILGARCEGVSLLHAGSRQGAGAAEGGGRHDAGRGHHERAAAPGHQGHGAGRAGAAQQGRLQGRAEEPGARPVHPGLAQQQLRPVRLDQCRQPRSGRIFLPHVPHRRIDKRVQVFGCGDRRASRQARATQDQAARKAAYDKVQKKLACSGPVAHLAYSTLFSAMRDKLQGYDIMPNRSLVSLRDATLGLIARPRRLRRALLSGASERCHDLEYRAAMSKHLLARLIDLVVVLFGVSVIVFLMIRLIPGDAVAIMLGANTEITPERVAELRARIGLDRPMVEQYCVWAGRPLRGDFGTSLWTGRPVSQRDPACIFGRRSNSPSSSLVIGAGAGGARRLPDGADARRRGADVAMRVGAIAGLDDPVLLARHRADPAAVELCAGLRIARLCAVLRRPARQSRSA